MSEILIFFNYLKTKVKESLILRLLLLVIAIKLFLLFFAYINFGFDKSPWESWTTIWSRWDSRAYITIALGGYSSTNNPSDYFAFLSHFPPLYPLTIRFFSIFYLPPPLAGIISSIIFSIAASYFLFKLVLLDFNNTKTAFWSVVFMSVYPVSYFTVSVYSESLFMFFVILSFYLTRRGGKRIGPIGGGLAGAGAVLTRITGLNMIPVFIFTIIKKIWDKTFKREWLFLLVLICIGFGVYLLLNQVYFGSYRFFYDEKISFNWTKELTFPLKKTIGNFNHLIGHLADASKDKHFMFTEGYNSVFTLVTLFLVIMGIIKKIPWDYTIYSISSLLFFSSFSWGISDARYTLPIFPIFITLALIKKTWLKYSLLSFSFSLLLYFTKIFTGGGWAF